MALAAFQPASPCRSHKMPFRVPESTNWCILLQREMGSERLLWMFLLGPAECVAIRKEDKRTKRKSATQMFLFAVSLLKQPRAPFSLSK